MFNTEALTRAKIQNIVGCVMNEYDGQNCIVPAWRRGVSNSIWSVSGGGGDAVITNGVVDGDLLITVGWGDGFAIRRLNDDGSMTVLYHDNSALYRDTTSTYGNIMNLTLHKPSKKAIISSYNVNGYSIIDYTDCLVGGGNTVINNRPPSQYLIDTDGIKIDSMGNSYSNGLVTAGDWVYVGSHDANHYKKYPRRNIVTDVEEILDGTTDALSGSAIIDRNGYRYTLRYDEVNDRVFYFSYYNGNFMLVTDASTASPKLVWCDMADIGVGNDAYEQCLFVEDPINTPNTLFVGAVSRIAKIDITPCFTGSSATLLQEYFTEDTGLGQGFGCQFQAGTINQAIDGDSCDKSPIYPGFIPTSPDRGRNMLDGWLDTDNERIVGVYRYNNTTEDTTTLGRGRSYRSDYGPSLFKMYSTNGTPYWVKTGYGYDGHGFRVWDDTIGPHMIDNWEIVFGDFTLDDSSDIGTAFISNMDEFTVPSGCGLTVFITNNGGVSWEPYNYNVKEGHLFTSTGNTIQVKLIGSGFPDKGPHKMSTRRLMVHFSNTSKVAHESNIKYKITRTRLTGGN